MKIRTIRHKGLRRLIEEGDRSGLPGAVIDKVEKMVAFLEAMEEEDELHRLVMWKPHQLTGDQRGTWSLHVTKNWRLTFSIEHRSIEIVDLDYQDYH